MTAENVGVLVFNGARVRLYGLIVSPGVVE